MHNYFKDCDKHFDKLRAENKTASPLMAIGFNRGISSGYGMDNRINTVNKAGWCIPWEEKRKEIPSINGDESLVKQIWVDVDSFRNMFIWQCLLSF